MRVKTESGYTASEQCHSFEQGDRIDFRFDCPALKPTAKSACVWFVSDSCFPGQATPWRRTTTTLNWISRGYAAVHQARRQLRGLKNLRHLRVAPALALFLMVCGYRGAWDQGKKCLRSRPPDHKKVRDKSYKEFQSIPYGFPVQSFANEPCVGRTWWPNRSNRFLTTSDADVCDLQA